MALAVPSVATLSSTTAESSTDRLNDHINLLTSTTLIAFFFGIISTLYIIISYYLLKTLLRRSGSKMEWRKTLFYVIYTSVLFLLASAYAAAASWSADVIYVDNRLYPEGPYQYYMKFMSNQPCLVVSEASLIVTLWMADGLILSRFVMFYRRVPYLRWIIPLPCVMYVTVVVLSSIVFQGAIQSKTISYSQSLVVAYYSISCSLNVLSAVLIAGRLYWHKVQLQRAFGPSIIPPYMDFVTLLVESATLYGVWSIVGVVLSALNSPIQTPVMATMNQIEVIAPYLIILGIARGTAWKGRIYGEEQDEVQDWQISSNRMERFDTIGSRPTRVRVLGSGFDVDPSTSTAEASGTKDDVNLIELGLGGSKSLSTSISTHDRRSNQDLT